ncbi:PH domain-containing protein [Sphingomonas sp. GCM10030256]|uniref:PH domain-containing protein n=1 Tax=Sphingomonas sp. GCM10030256 TaxID=3273427 RepID=UPI00361C16EF
MIAEPHSPDVAPVERLHPFFLLTGLGRSLRQVAGGYAGIAYLAATGRISTAVLVGIALFAFLGVSLFLYWRRFSFRVGAHELRIDSGILNRTHRSIPFDRVQDVDISQGPVARLLGLAQVKFETGGSAAASSDDGVLPAIALARAQDLREYVRSRRGAAAVPSAEVSNFGPLFSMSLPRVLLSGMFGFSLAIFAGLFGASQTLGDVIGFDPLEPSFWRDLFTGSPVAAFVMGHQVAAAIGGLLVLVLAGFATGIVRSLLRDYRFRLERTGTGLRRRRGLLTITDVTLPLRRVQAALIRSGPVRSRFGWSELRLQSLARDEESKGDHVVAPLARPSEVQAVLDELGWPDNSPAWERLPFAHVTSFALLALPLLVAGLLWLLLFLWAAALAGSSPDWRFDDQPAAAVVLGPALLYPVLVTMRWLSWKREAFSLSGEHLLVRSGWWRRRTVVLPLANVQSIDLTENALGRKFGIAALVIGVAGGSGFAGHRIPALCRKRADEVRAELLSRFA